MTRYGTTYSPRSIVHKERTDGEHGAWTLIYDAQYRDQTLKFSPRALKRVDPLIASRRFKGRVA